MSDRKSLPVKKPPRSTATAQEVSELRKASEAVAIKPRSGRITLLTRKIFNVLLFHAQQQGEGTKTYRLGLWEIVHDASFDSNDTAIIKEHLDKMLGTKVEWHTNTAEERSWEATNLLSYVKVSEHKDSRRCYVEWRYEEEIKTRLLEPSKYVKLSLQFQSRFRSSAALALYEICARYATNPSHVTMREAWQWWRPRLTGLPDEQSQDGAYSEYKYFKRDYLKSAVSEINRLTDLEVELVEFKNGRRVEEIQFRVNLKAQSGLLLDEPNMLDMKLVSRMMALGLSQKDVERYYGEFEEPMIAATLDLVEARQKSSRQPPLESPAAYFREALRKGYAKAAPVPPASAPARPVRKRAGASKDDVREAMMAERRTDAQAMYDEQDGFEQREQLDAFALEVLGGLPAPMQRSFARTGIESKPLSVAFFNWLALRTWGVPTDEELLQYVLERANLSA